MFEIVIVTPDNEPAGRAAAVKLLSQMSKAIGFMPN